MNRFHHCHNQKNEDAPDRYVAQANRTFEVPNGQLEKSGGESILPGGFTAVDAHFYPWILQHSFAQLSLDKYPKVKTWLEKIGSRKDVKEAYDKIPNGKHA